MRMISASAPRNTSTAAHQAREPFATFWIVVMTLLGKREMMLAKRMMEMPLPTPNSVICSPSHMIRAEPEVKVRMMMIAAQTLLEASATMMPLFFISM